MMLQVILGHLLPLGQSHSLLAAAKLALYVLMLVLKLLLASVMIHYLYYQLIWKRFVSPSPKPFAQYLKERAQRAPVLTASTMANKQESREAYSKRPDSVPADFSIINDDDPIDKFLSAVRIFTYIDPVITEQVAAAAEQITVRAGETLDYEQEQKSKSPHVYVLRRGRFKICSSAVCEEGVEMVGPGDFLTSLFEIIAVVSGATQDSILPKRVTALTDSIVIKIPVETIREVCLARPNEAHNVVRVVLTRFQRIICSSMFSHFGLNNEVYRIDQAAAATPSNEMSNPLSIGEAKTILVDHLLLMLGIDEAEWDSFHDSISYDTDLLTESLLEGGCLPIDGFFLVVSGKVTVSMAEYVKKHGYGPRGFFGSTMSVFGSKAMTVATASEPATLVHLTQKALMKLFERKPKAYVGLAKLLLPQLSPMLCFIDMTLEWLHVNAGAALAETGSLADSLYIVIHGRLRVSANKKVVAEVGSGETYGEAELFQSLPWRGTISAVRYTELVRVPKDLFDMLIRKNPESGLRIAKVIASRQAFTHHETSHFLMSESQLARKTTIKTLAIIPSNAASILAAESLCKKLYSVIGRSDSCTILTKSSAVSEVGKHIFTAFGKIRLIEWLNLQEDMHRVVIYFADSITSPWTHRCIRQADCIFVVADARKESTLGEYEHLILSIPANVRIELVLAHQSHHCPSGLTRKWLEPRPWIAQHHHITLPIDSTRASRSHKGRSFWKFPEMNWGFLADQLMTQGFRRTLRHHLAQPSSDTDYSVQDVERLARRVLGTSVGLVLGGGGARGLSHVGIIKTLVDEGVPIDAIGGTSIGALVGGLYARDANLFTSTALLRVFSALMSSKWRLAYDLTYPFCAWFTGESFNRALWKIFEERLIEDMWIPFYCITTDIAHSKMTVHKSSLAWRYIRASMTLSGFLPPLWDEGNALLLDGGYTNNLPVDVMLSEYPHVSQVIAVDVGSERSDVDEYYHHDVSGSWLLFRRLLGMKSTVPNLADIQGRLAYVACVERINQVKSLAQNASSGIYYLRPPVQAFATLEFDKFDLISSVGIAYGAEIISSWRQNGTLALLRPLESSTTLDQADSIDLDETTDTEEKYPSFRHRRRSL